MLGLIFFLLLTLGNAWLMHRERQFVHHQDYAAFQIGQRRMHKVEWEAFAWREFGALALTVVVFAGIAAYARRVTPLP